MNLCMSYQAGVHNTVAVSGTAFTDEHIHIIKRFCDTVILSFDTDTAGQNALKKTGLLCLLGGIDVYVVGDIGLKDPADVIKEQGNEVWIRAVEKKRHIVDVMLLHILEEEKDERKQGQRIVTEVLPFIRAIQSPIDRAHFIRVISQKSHIPEQTLTEELSRGILSKPDIEKVETQTMPSKERLTREIIAFTMLTNTHNDERVTSLSIDFKQFPEAIIQEEMFTLEERVIGDKEKYLSDLLKTFKKEVHKEELMILQQKLRSDGVDKEKVMKEIYDHVKRGPEVIYGL